MSIIKNTEVKNQQVVVPFNLIEGLKQEKNIPVISKSTREMFNSLECKPETVPADSLKEKVRTMSQIGERLKYARDHETRNKIITLVAVAIGVAVIALGVIASLPFVCSGGFFIYLMIAVASCEAIIHGIGGLLASAGLIGLLVFSGTWAGLGIINSSLNLDCETDGEIQQDKRTHPIFNPLNRVSLLEKYLKEVEGEVNTQFSEMSSFFEQDLGAVKEALNKKVQECENLLEENLTNYSPTYKKEVCKNKIKYENVLSELESLIKFYKQYSENSIIQAQ